jgi:hypothetical protein
MKSAGGWHKGRLSKDSNTEKIMELVKKGGAVLADDEAPQKAAEVALFFFSRGAVLAEFRRCPRPVVRFCKNRICQKKRPRIPRFI